MQLQLEVTAVANLKCAKWRKLSSSTRMMYDPYSMSNAGRRLGFNFRSSTTQASPLAMEHMERPYNGPSNLHHGRSHLSLDDSATASSDGVSPFSSNSNSLGIVSLQPFFSKLFV